MNNDLQILQSVFDRIESRIKEEQKRKGIIASGRSAKSLKSTVSKSGSTIRGVLTGNESFEQQERGSTASENKKRPFAELLKDIREWTNYKKFSKSKPSHIKDIIAFQVTKHLRERGSLRGNTSDYPGLNISGIIKEETTNMKSKLSENYVSSIRSQLIKVLK